MSDRDCRARRLREQREALGRDLVGLLNEMPDAICFDFTELRHLAGYRVLEPEGLVHARLFRPGGCFIILAATRRVLKDPGLRKRLFALRNLARRELKRVLIATPRGLRNETIRLRIRRAAGLAVFPATSGPRET